MSARRLSTLSLFAVAALLAVACGELPHPFQAPHNNEEDMKLMPIDKAGMVVQAPAGMPGPAAAAFTKALIDALRDEDVAAMSGPGNPASLVLGGTATADPTGWNIKMALADASQAPVGSVASHASPLAANDPKSWSPFAKAMAKSIADLLQTDGTTSRKDQPSVTIGDISGLPDGDRRMLVHALEFDLQKSRLQIATSPDKATHVIVGNIRITPANGLPGQRMNNVDVRWTVQRADKTEIGQLHQSNDVPVDMIDRDWPDIAMAVADAAVGGIVDLVNQGSSAAR
jgi:hypothetical protein